MPLQNRVTPWAEIVAVPDRGLFMGNRGCLHDAHRRLVKAWARTPWVTCLLHFAGRHRDVMSPGQYTELFFLDEATALAAGHRPCATCRRGDYDSFKAYWLVANPELAATIDGMMASIDRLLHAERVDHGGHKRTWLAQLGELPDGTMVVREGSQTPLLVRRGNLFRWTPAGYSSREAASPQTPLQVLTPRSVVKTLARGYQPVLHPSVVALDSGRVKPMPEPVKPVSDQQTPHPPAIGRPDQPAAKKPLPGPTTSHSDTVVNAERDGLFRLDRTPAGTALYTYFAAILIATEMDKGAAYPLKRFLKNFSGHEQAGRIEQAPGGYRLTRAGRDYFADRYRPGNPQHVDHRDVEAMVRLIRTGQGLGWVPLEDYSRLI